MQLPEKYLHRNSSSTRALDRIIPEALPVGTQPREVATTSLTHSIVRNAVPRERISVGAITKLGVTTNVENSFSPLCRPRRVYVRSGAGPKPQRRAAQHRGRSQDDQRRRSR